VVRQPLSIAQVLEKTSFATGSVWQMFDAARQLAARGHRVVAVTRASDEMARRCGAVGVEHLSLPLRSRFDVRSMRRLAHTLADREVDVVHAYRGVAHAVALGARHLGCGAALVVNRSVSFHLGAVAALKYRSSRVQRVIAVCEHIRQGLIASGALPPTKVDVVYGGVDTRRFDPDVCHPERLREELGIPAAARVVGHVGMRDWRGWKELLRAFPVLRERHPDAHLLLVACTSELQRMTVLETAAEMKLGGAVTATLAREDMPDVLAACAVVVDPSWAGIGITGSIREAMALAKPVVATSIAGNPELVENGSSGILVEPRDVPMLTAAISHVLDDARLAAQLGRNAQRRVRKRFSAEIRAARLEQVYVRALRDLRRPRSP
jgi:glycosyltransferase involved in cell wall biosynthesis